EPIQLAIRRNATAIVKQLVAAGVKPGTAYTKAIDDGNAELVLALVEAGADPKPAAAWAARIHATNIIAALTARGVAVPKPKGPPVELLSYAEATAFLKARRIKV